MEDALSVAPSSEHAHFLNRENFDLVVMYDNNSQSFGASISPMSVAVRVIYETAIHHMLKRPPVILVGGLRAWLDAFPNEVASEGVGAAIISMGRMSLSSSSMSPVIGGKPGLPNGTSDGVSRGIGSSSPQEIRSPTSSSHGTHAMDQIPEGSRYVH